MIQLQKILVPTDFSDNARIALDYAAELARSRNAEVLLVHVMEPPIYPVSFGVGPTNLPLMEQDIRRHVEEALERLRREAFGDTIRCRCIVREGQPFVEIVKAAREEGADMIVISTHGHSGIKHLLLGSTAERVVRKAPCPVLTVRQPGREFEMP